VNRSLLLVGMLTLAPLGPAVAEGWSSAERQGIELLRGLRDPSAPAPPESGMALAALGPQTVELLLEVLEERSVPGVEDGDEAQLLSQPQRETILVALEDLGRSAVLPLLDARLEVAEADSPVSRSRRAMGIAALGAVARPGELKRLVELARDPELGGFESALGPELEDAVERATLRDTDGFAVLADLARDLDPSAAEFVLQGVGATGDARGVEVLAQLASGSPRLQNLVAAQVPLLGPSLEPSWNRELAGALQGGLSSDSRNLCAASAMALGELEDFSAVPELIGLLDSEDAGLRSAAHLGLTRLLNRPASPSVGAWRHWLRVETTWLEREAPRLFSQSRGEDVAVAVAALEELGRHRLERHRLALEVGLALAHDSASVRRAACLALTGLGSRWAAQDLHLALGDPDPSVAMAAAEALAVVTGELRGADPAAWDDYEFPDPDAY